MLISEIVYSQLNCQRHKTVLTWWTDANSRQEYRSNLLKNAVGSYDDKIEFYLKLVDWFQDDTNSNFCLSRDIK